MIKVVFFGSSRYVLPIIEALQKNFNLCFVITTEKFPGDAVPSFCKKNKIDYIPVLKFDKEVIEQIKLTKATIGVLAYFGLILPQEVLDVFPNGIINTHPSLLPKYRGPTPGQTAILNGDKNSGVTIIKLDSEIDHGLILDQIKLEIETNETAETLYERFFEVGAKMLPRVISNYIKGQIKPSAQNDSKASFTQHLTKENGFISLNNPQSPELLDRMIRAFHPWPGVWFKTKLGEQNRIVKLLPGQKIQVSSKKPMTYKDFANGYKEGTEILSVLGLKPEL